MDRLRSGAISLWGKVGECNPPHLVLPLTVEYSELRLCNDDRFLNLWIEDRPFPWIVSNIWIRMFIKAFTRQCVTTSQDTIT